jgi:hypothetical protein
MESYNVISYHVSCPYCGESFEALIDNSESDSEYIEDCYVCCRPITFTCSVSFSGELVVSVRGENDTY